MSPKALVRQQTKNTHDDQIDRHEDVEQAGKYQDQNPSHQSDDRLKDYKIKGHGGSPIKVAAAALTLERGERRLWFPPF